MKRFGSWFWSLSACLAVSSSLLAAVPGDADGDGDLDADDFALMTVCHLGPDVAAISICRDLFDFDAEFDVDLADFASLQRCFSGPNQPASPDCMPHTVRIEDGCLAIYGTAADSELAIRIGAGTQAGFLQIDVGDDGIAEFNVDRNLFDCIDIDARGGNDTIRIDESNGIFTDTTLTTLRGGPGNDTLLGGSGGEIFVGGDGDDILHLGDGNDRAIWNSGDDTDVVNGEGGIDTIEVNGGANSEDFTVTANGLRVRFDRLAPALFHLDIGTCENLVLNAGAGDDSLACTGNLAALIAITADGGPGNDTLRGSNGPDILIGGDDDDFVDGNQGVDITLLGAGNDVFQWDPGDGNDTVEGQAGDDSIHFNGSNANEIMEFSANGARLRFTRNVGSIVLDADEIESFALQTLGGTDNVIVNDLADTALQDVNVNLTGTFGGTAGDAQPDNVIVNGTNGADNLAVAGGITGTLVLGMPTLITVVAADAASDRITINCLSGHDQFQATGLAAGVIGLTVNGGAGNDVLLGSAGADQLNGDDDDDTIDGGGGDDIVLLGNGNDRFIWNPGDSTDFVEGGDGVDIIEVNGSDSTENFTITANGTRVRFDRLAPTPFALDIGTCERLVLNANGGNDMFACTGNLAPLIQITADGGPGEDSLLGSNGADVLIGGDDNDFIDGNQGADIILMGAGNDVFRWDPGDGSDIVEGQEGQDTIDFNGSGANELFDISANGQRLRFVRNIGNITIDAGDIEQFDLQMLGGADGVTVHDLTQTDLEELNVELAGTLGGTTGDAQTDHVVVNGTQGADIVHVAANAGIVEVVGLSSIVRVFRSEAANDSLIVNGLAGTDIITADPGVFALIMLTMNP